MANTTINLRVDKTKIISGICKGVSKAIKNTIKYVAFNSNELHVFWEVDNKSILKTLNDQPRKDSSLSEITQKESVFHSMWLRDNDQSPVSRHPSNGQRLFNIIDVPEDLHITNAKVEWRLTRKYCQNF